MVNGTKPHALHFSFEKEKIRRKIYPESTFPRPRTVGVVFCKMALGGRKDD